MSDSIRLTILQQLEQLSEQAGGRRIEVTDEVNLLDTGLDSIDFATLVAVLEMSLGYDPFVEMDEPVYPTTFGEFVAIYEKYRHLRIVAS